MDRQVAVVTGASGGIGAEFCKSLGADGWCVALAARRREELDKVAAICGARTRASRCHLSCRESC